jgi:hypothetical protein
MKRSVRHGLLLASLVLVTAATLPGCKGSEPSSKQADRELPPIEPIEGMKYYVGGPLMKYDAYGRLRLGGFSGEVATPVSRGLMIGYKPSTDGKSFEYRTWVNGRAVSKSTGFLDAKGLLWVTERESYDSNGTVVTRQHFTFDDQAMKMTGIVEELDPKTGAVIRTGKMEEAYKPGPPPDEPQDEEGEEDDGATGGDDSK